MNIHLCLIRKRNFEDKLLQIISALMSYELNREPIVKVVDRPTRGESENLFNELPYNEREVENNTGLRNDRRDHKTIVSGLDILENDNVAELEVVEESEACMETREIICALVSESNINIDPVLNSVNAVAIKSVVEDTYLIARDAAPISVDYHMKIKLVNDVPVFSGPRRLSWREKCKVEIKLAELLEGGIISQSESPYASPIVLVKKKDGGLRITQCPRSRIA